MVDVPASMCTHAAWPGPSLVRVDVEPDGEQGCVDGSHRVDCVRRSVYDAPDAGFAPVLAIPAPFAWGKGDVHFFSRVVMIGVAHMRGQHGDADETPGPGVVGSDELCVRVT